MLQLSVRHYASPNHCSFFCSDTPPPEIYTLSLHDALPIFDGQRARQRRNCRIALAGGIAQFLQGVADTALDLRAWRSEEHTSELQSHVNLVCRLLLEKKKNQITTLYVLIQYSVTSR